MKDLIEIAKQLGCSLEFDNDFCMKNQAAISGDEIMLGSFDKIEDVLPAFFHEVGHRMSKIKVDSLSFEDEETTKLVFELDAWLRGFACMSKLGYGISSRNVMYCLFGLLSYSNNTSNVLKVLHEELFLKKEKVDEDGNKFLGLKEEE